MTDVITNQEVDANIVKTVRNLKTHSSSKQAIKDISSNQIEDSKNNTNSQFNKSLPVFGRRLDENIRRSTYY